jgi:hypothetical protein
VQSDAFEASIGDTRCNLGVAVHTTTKLMQRTPITAGQQSLRRNSAHENVDRQ